MGILEPLALLLIPALGAIIALYLLRFRRPVAPVPSVALWERTLRDREANTLWQRLRVSILLIVQLATLLLLIVAVARPWTLGTGERVRHTVLVVDVSASMSGHIPEEGISRLDDAKDQARDAVSGLDGGGTATLIAAGAEPIVLVSATSDKARLRSAISALSAEPVSGDMLAALRLAAAITEGRADSSIQVFSDGAFPDLTERVELSGQRLEFHGIEGARSEEGNQGISAMSLTGPPGSASLFLQVANSSPVTVTRRLELSADDEPWEARTLEMGGGQTLEVDINNVPADARVLRATLAGTDPLRLDDDAWVVSRANTPVDVLLVSEGNRFLEVSLSLLPGVSLYKVDPGKYSPEATLEGDPFDLTVIDAGAPVTAVAALPLGNLLIFSPPASLPGITVTGVLTNPLPAAPAAPEGEPSQVRSTSLDVAGLTRTQIARAAALQPGSGSSVLLGSDKGPLIVASESEGVRMVAVAFALSDSDLPLQAAFPIMMRDLVNLLRPDNSLGLPAAVEPLGGVRLVPADASVNEILVEDPSGRERTFRDEPSGVTFADTSLPGAYYVTHYSDDKIVWQGAFAVNLFAREESILPPDSSALAALEAEREFGGRSVSTESSRNEIWPAFAILAILMLLFEWAYANRIAIRRAITEARARRPVGG
jgi:hypothetical protein